MNKSITEVLGIKYPIIQGAMAWVSESGLAAAMAEGGATGVIASGGREAAWVRDEIRKAKALTDKPFGVNLMLMAKNLDEIEQVILEEKPAFVTTGAGNPVPYIEKMHAVGIKIIPVVPSLKLAKRVADAGADAIIIEGMEAGGHIGQQTTMALMTNVLPEVDIPVVVAGGIADGRGAAAAFLMGAGGVQMGTRFILAEECVMHENAKQKIINATDTDSVVTGYSRGHGVRGLKCEFTAEFLKLEKEGAPDEELNKLATGTNYMAAVEGDCRKGLVQAGMSVVPLKKIQPAAEIISELMEETKQVLNAGPAVSKKIFG